MDLEDDPTFWEWLIEQQKSQDTQKDAFVPMVLELPLPPPREEEPEMGEIADKTTDSNLDVPSDYVIFEF